MLHTIIIWESGFNHIGKILYELQLFFEIKHYMKIQWNEENILTQLNRIYPNRTFNLDSPKIKEIGGYNLFLFVINDPNPDIVDGVNQNIKFYKQKLRFLGINYLHGSDNELESWQNYNAVHEIERCQYERYSGLSTLKLIRDPKAREISIKQFPITELNDHNDLFRALGECGKYVVLRNWEFYPEAILDNNHQDMDILVEDRFSTLVALNAKPAFHDTNRSRYYVSVGDEVVQMDIRFISDGYYDHQWEIGMLERRARHTKGFYILNPEDYFWSLLYHEIFHKGKVREDTRKVLLPLMENISDVIPEDLENERLLEIKIIQFLNKNKLKLCSPEDYSVTLKRYKLVSKQAYRLKALIKRLVTRERYIPLKTYPQLEKYFNPNVIKLKVIKRRVFYAEKKLIKISEPQHRFILENEYKFLTLLKNENCFPQPLIHKRFLEFDCLITKFKTGRDINKYFRLNAARIKVLKTQLYHILEIFRKHKIVHNDIRPNNIIYNKYTDQYTLIDFGNASRLNHKSDKQPTLETMLKKQLQSNLGGDWVDKSAQGFYRDQSAVTNIIEHFDHQREFSLKTYWKFLRNKIYEYSLYK